jgi:hypothetical protein
MEAIAGEVVDVFMDLEHDVVCVSVSTQRINTNDTTQKKHRNSASLLQFWAPSWILSFRFLLNTS